MRPVPHPEVGVRSTELPIPNALQVVNISDLDPCPATTVTFSEVLERRRSVRTYGSLDAADLAALLVMVFALRGFALADDGAIRRFRPIPSAGGRHPLVPIVLVEDVVGLDRGLWRFDPDGQRLLQIHSSGQHLDTYWTRACAAGEFAQRPPAVVVLAAKFDATLARYPMGSTLVWRDAGVALGSLHLTAGSLGLGSCILGTVGIFEDDVFVACGVRGNLVGDVGALAVGSNK
ncbi:SagB family peptide dehydrogenase [Rhodococcus sp. IEGM 1318]|uniref:SagB family peptide dehydrogenase n=1 Tax=Rhodococcus sp. IEGM 1318 TaxID=3082226 RepID=UPI003989AB75